MKRMTWILFAYSMFFMLILWMKDHPRTFSPWDSGRGLPASIAQFFSTGWMWIGWEFLCTFWLALHPDSRHTPISLSQ
jgi:hypothetical protein